MSDRVRPIFKYFTVTTVPIWANGEKNQRALSFNRKKEPLSSAQYLMWTLCFFCMAKVHSISIEMCGLVSYFKLIHSIFLQIQCCFVQKLMRRKKTEWEKKIAQLIIEFRTNSKKKRTLNVFSCHAHISVSRHALFACHYLAAGWLWLNIWDNWDPNSERIDCVCVSIFYGIIDFLLELIVKHEFQFFVVVVANNMNQFN